MASESFIFLAMCLVLTLIDVNALQCHQKDETECSGSDAACNFIAGMAQQYSTPIGECSPWVEGCISVISNGTVPNGTFNTSKRSCDIYTGGKLTANSCYDRAEIDDQSPEFGLLIAHYEGQEGIQFTSYVLCICNESLCNDVTDEFAATMATSTRSESRLGDSSNELTSTVATSTRSGHRLGDFTNELTSTVPTSFNITSTLGSSSVEPLLGFSILFTMVLTGFSMSLI